MLIGDKVHLRSFARDRLVEAFLYSFDLRLSEALHIKFEPIGEGRLTDGTVQVDFYIRLEAAPELLANGTVYIQDEGDYLRYTGSMLQLPDTSAVFSDYPESRRDNIVWNKNYMSKFCAALGLPS